MSDHGWARAGDRVAGADSIGWWLQARRLELGASVDDVSEALKLQGFYIEALEAEAFERLPARSYAIGYVRSLAQAYGLDPDEAAARLRVSWPLSAPLDAPNARPFPEAERERRFPTSAVLSLTIVVAIAAYAYWYATRSAEVGRPLLSPVAELEETAAPPEPSLPTPAPGPLQLLGVPDLAQSVEATDALGPEAVPPEKQALPVDPLPRPRPGTDAAAVFAATYRMPVLPDDAAHDKPGVTPTRMAGQQVESLPASASLAAYLPAVRLRSDLGPLRTGAVLQTLLPVSRPHLATRDDEPVSTGSGRTQAFAAVPAEETLAGGREAGERAPVATGSGSYDVMTSLPPSDNQALPAIAILADASCWVEIRTERGKLVLQRLLAPGERMDVPPRRDLILTAGNAGGIRVLVNGITAPALGGKGQVVRGVKLTRQELLAHR
ncbi:MAG: DUF4115 domain-containing protein [Alphaproteobacteria bacterium]|nr:DUF4115 domain-containing protein [Alphaproteobacteria bacterium]